MFSVATFIIATTHQAMSIYLLFAHMHFYTAILKRRNCADHQGRIYICFGWNDRQRSRHRAAIKSEYVSLFHSPVVYTRMPLSRIWCVAMATACRQRNQPLAGVNAAHACMHCICDQTWFWLFANFIKIKEIKKPKKKHSIRWITSDVCHFPELTHESR